jgi:hypothetical protein
MNLTDMAVPNQPWRLGTVSSRDALTYWHRDDLVEASKW